MEITNNYAIKEKMNPGADYIQLESGEFPCTHVISDQLMLTRCCTADIDLKDDGYYYCSWCGASVLGGF